MAEEALSKRWFSSVSKSLPLEGKVAQRERSRMRWISKSISSYGSDERIAFVSLNTSSVNFVASFPSRGSRFLEERTYTPPCGSDTCASGKQKPSEKKLFLGRFKFVSFRQTGSCINDSLWKTDSVCQCTGCFEMRTDTRLRVSPSPHQSGLSHNRQPQG